MARVPTVSGPRVEERALPGPFERSSASPELLAGNSRQLGAAGQAMMEVGLKLQERQDADELMRAETAITGKYLEWEGEAKQRKGQNAWGVAKEAGEWWDKEALKVAGEITSPRAQTLFQREAMKKRALAVGTFSGFEAGQRRASLEESAQASIVGSINQAAANPTNTEVLATSKSDLLKRTQMLVQINGWTPEMADAKRTENLTNFHKQVIQGLVRDTPETAEAYFHANKGEIEGSQHAEVGAFAVKATATRIGEAAADAAWQTLGPRGDREPVQLDKLEQSIRARSDISDEAKKTSIAALRERTAAFKDSRRERDEQLEAKVNTAVLQGAGATQIQRMPEFMQMDGEKQRRLVDFMESRAVRKEQLAAARESRVATAEGREQTRLTRQGMGDYLRYSNPDNLASMTENQVINLLPVLGNELTNHLMTQKRALSAPGKLTEARMDQDDFNHVGRQMGLPIDDKASPAQKEALGELKFRVEQVIAANQRAGGKVMNRDEKIGLMRQEMARTVTVNPGMFSSNKDTPVIALSRDEVAKVVIPAADRQQITATMKTMYERTKSGAYAPTDENLRRFYLLSKSSAAGLILPPKK